RLRLPEEVVEERRAGECDRAEQVRGAAAPRIGNDPRRHLEDHHPGGEEGVRGEGFQLAEPRIEQEQGADPRDERRGQRVAEQEALRAELGGRGVRVEGKADDEGREAPELDLSVDLTSAGVPDSMTLFMNELGRYPLLTAAEEVELAKRIERGDARAKERMIN